MRDGRMGERPTSSLIRRISFRHRLPSSNHPPNRPPLFTHPCQHPTMPRPRGALKLGNRDRHTALGRMSDSEAFRHENRQLLSQQAWAFWVCEGDGRRKWGGWVMVVPPPLVVTLVRGADIG
jgi:hypothetical protein